MWQCSISNSRFVCPKWHRKIYNVALRARGRRWLREDDGVVGSRMAQGQRRRGLWDSAGLTVSWAGERRGVDSVACSSRTMVLKAPERHRVDGIANLGTTPTWSMASPAQVGEDGDAYGGLDRGREWRLGGSGEVDDNAGLGKFW
jgi:hypothetical protein